LVLCCKCFADKRYPMVLKDTDFDMSLQPQTRTPNKTNLCEAESHSAESSRAPPFDAEELSKLKEALRLYRDDWSKVSGHTGRDAKECIAEFLKLPIADSFISAVEARRDVNAATTCTSKVRRLSFLKPAASHTPSPFADAGHPVLGQVASLTALVDNEMVAVAAAAALKHVQSIGEREGQSQSNGNGRGRVDRADRAKVGQRVRTAKGEGVVESVKADGACVVRFAWGSSVVKKGEMEKGKEKEKERESGKGWSKVPSHVAESKANAAGVLGTGAVMARALKQQESGHLEQVMQHLVLLQSAKVKAKLAHLDELWLVLQKEREEVQAMKKEVFRERIEVAKQRLLIKQERECSKEEAAVV